VSGYSIKQQCNGKKTKNASIGQITMRA